MTKSSNLYVGMDVHKESIDIALADDDGLQEIRHYGRIGGNLPALDQAIRNLQGTDRVAPGVAFHTQPTLLRSGAALR